MHSDRLSRKKGFYTVNVDDAESDDVASTTRVCPARIIQWKKKSIKVI